MYRNHELNAFSPYCDFNFDDDGYPGDYVYGDDVYIDDYYMEELWKPVKGFERNYWVSNFGRVWSSKSNSFLTVKPMDNHGHLGVCLYNNGKRHYWYIHRLVAEAFIPNPDNHPIVRHIYDNPQFNTYEDLAWGTHRDNFFDSVRNGRAYIPTDIDREKGNLERKTPIIAINIKNGNRLYFDSQGEASRILNIPQSNIWKVLVGQRVKAGNYTFTYDERGGRYGNY